jgi:hypothetical protein
VVLELLSAIYNSQVPIETQRLSDTGRRVLAESAQKQAKSSRIEEWKSFPLNTDEERLSWWSKRQDLITKGIEANPSHISQASPAQTESWMMESSPTVVHYEDLRSSTIEHSNVSSAQQPQPAQPAWQLIQDVSGALEPAPVPYHQDQNVAGVPPVENPASEGYLDDRPERPVSSAPHTALNPKASTTEQWRKYF